MGGAGRAGELHPAGAGAWGEWAGASDGGGPLVARYVSARDSSGAVWRAGRYQGTGGVSGVGCGRVDYRGSDSDGRWEFGDEWRWRTAGADHGAVWGGEEVSILRRLLRAARPYNCIFE